MIQSVTVVNFRNDKLTIELANPEKSGFAISDITGLGPVKATVNTIQNAISDGAVFNSAYSGTRNIVMKLRFVGNDIETVRQKTYKYFPVKQNLKLLIETDNRALQIEGYVESNEPTIFSKTEGCNISIICPYPYFAIGNMGLTELVFGGIDSAFEFPFENASLTESLLEFGIVRLSTYGNVLYDGDTEIGILITLHAKGAVNAISIYNSKTKEKMILDMTRIVTLTGTAFGDGDELIISTVQNDKYIRLLRNGVYTNALLCLDLTSDWFKISKGDNIFSYTADTGDDNLQMRIQNNVIYDGV